MPATRPWRLATVPRAMCTGRLDTRWNDSAQSPAAHTWSVPVRCRRSTAMAPLGPSSTPASPASSALGSTPRPSTTRSAASTPALVCTRPGSKPSTATPVRASTPKRRRASSTSSAMSGSRVDITWLLASTRTTRRPPLDERLGHLEPDVAATDDDHVAGTSTRRSSSSRAAPSSRVCTPRTNGRSMPGRSGPSGPGAGGDQQLVEAERRTTGRGRGRRPRPAGVDVDRHDLVLHADVDALVPELLRRPHDQGSSRSSTTPPTT